MAVSSGPKSVVVLLEGVVLEDGYPGPMMESIVKGIIYVTKQASWPTFAEGP